MLEEFLTKVLVVLFGYAYPAFECFKMVEERPGEIEQLRFWCQYWIIVAIVTVIEMLAETVVSWVPLYDQVKLAFFVYLWYPKTKGSDLVYETFLRPLVMQYEPDIEQRLRHLRAKSGQFLMFYLKNFSDKGSTLFFEALNYVVSQGSRVSRTEVGIEPRGDQALIDGLLRHDGLHSRRCGRRRCQTAAPAQVIEKKDCENLLKLEKQKETSSRRFMNETNNVNTENSNATDELQFVQLLLSLC